MINYTYLIIGTTLIRRSIAFVEEQKNGSILFRFLPGIDDGVVYPSKIIHFNSTLSMLIQKMENALY